MVIPEVYAVGTATEAESAYKGVEAGGGISYDAAYDKGDYVVAVGAGHGFYVLTHEATAFIYVRGVLLVRASALSGRAAPSGRVG